MKVFSGLSLMLFMMAVAVAPAQAQSDDLVPYSSQPETLGASTTKGPFYYQSTGELRMRKLARGVANVTLCVAEVPNQIFQEVYRKSPVTGIFTGAWKGLVKGGKRLMIGAWEIATFYAPGKTNYQPYIEPEVVFQEYLH